MDTSPTGRICSRPIGPDHRESTVVSGSKRSLEEILPDAAQGLVSERTRYSPDPGPAEKRAAGVAGHHRHGEIVCSSQGLVSAAIYAEGWASVPDEGFLSARSNHTNGEGRVRTRRIGTRSNGWPV
jgi:hypothetical protein